MTEATVILEEETSVEKPPPSDWSVEKGLCGIFLIGDWCRRAQATMGGVTPKLVVLGAIQKQAAELWGGKPVSSTPP